MRSDSAPNVLGRSQEQDERDEHQTLLDLYLRATESEERAAKAA